MTKYHSISSSKNPNVYMSYYMYIGYNKEKVFLVFKAVPPAQQIGNIKLPREYTIGALLAFLKKKYPTICDDNTSLVLYIFKFNYIIDIVLWT